MSRDNPNPGSVVFKRAHVDADDSMIQSATAESSAGATTARGQTIADPGAGIIDRDRVMSSSQLDFEQFMRDELLVQMADPASEDDHQYAEVTVNGDYRLCVRGDQVRLRRYHVAVLAAAKQLRVSQKRVTTADGSMGYQEVVRSVLTYPFSVIEDPRGRMGNDWLRKIISTPL